MKTYVTALLVSLFITPAFAGPGDDPIMPWPTNVVRRQILPEDIQGKWVAYGENTLWFVNITLDNENVESIGLSIESNGVFTGAAKGWMLIGKDIFWGAVRMDRTHTSGVVIYRDYDGYKMRIYSRGMKKIYELQLFPDNK